MRRPVYFQYEMNSTESISKMVDSFMADWSQIVHLYCLIEDMAEYLRLGNLTVFVILFIINNERRVHQASDVKKLWIGEKIGK